MVDSSIPHLILSELLPCISVPLFFFISGYLFFLNLEQFTWIEYKKKISRRVKTVLIPYLIWATLFILYSYLHQSRLSLQSGAGFIDLRNWWHINGGLHMWWDSVVTKDSTNLLGFAIISARPYHQVLWFMRDLLVLFAVSPALSYLLMYKGKTVLWALLICYVFSLWPPIHSLTITGLFFYSSGAWVAISRQEFGRFFEKRVVAATVIAALLFIPMIIYHSSPLNFYLKRIWILSWGILFVTIISKLLSTRNSHLNMALRYCQQLSEASFFIYVTHMVVLSNIRQALILIPKKPLPDLLILFVLPILTIAFCVTAYYFIKRYFPGFCKIVSGNR